MSVTENPRPESTGVVLTTEPWDDPDGGGEGWLSICWTAKCRWNSGWQASRLDALALAGAHRAGHLAGEA